MPVRRSIRQAFLFSMVLVATLSCVAIGSLWIPYEYSRYRQDAANMREELLGLRKAQMKQQVDGAISFVNFKRQELEQRARQSIRNRVYEAHRIATHLYDRYHESRPAEDVQNIVREALRVIRFHEGRGYYFVLRMDGTRQMYPLDPASEGKNMLAMTGTRDAEVVSDMIDTVRADGEGFYVYDWPKPNHPDRLCRKISFVKRFEPFDWILGTGEYFEDIEEDLKAEAIDYIQQARVGEDGYMFAGQYDGRSLAGPVAGQNLFESLGPEGAVAARELIERAQTGGGYVQYAVPEKDWQRAGPKLSYAQGIDAWGWFIGTDVYIDDIEQALAAMREARLSDLRWAIVRICLALATLWLVAYVVAVRISGKAAGAFGAFASFFRDAATGQAEVSLDRLEFAEFEELAGLANRMVSERRRAEESLRDREQRLRVLFEQAGDAVFLTDRSGNLIQVNAEACRMTGYLQSELQSMNVVDLDLEAEPQQLQEFYGNLVEGVPVTIESRHLRKDGTETSVEIRAARLETPEGVLFLSTARDITTRKKAERALRESESKMRSIFRAAPIGIGVVADRVLTDVNERLCEMLGYAKAELVGQDSQMLYQSDDEYDRVGRERDRQVAEKGTASVESCWRHNDGHAIDVLLGLTPLDPSDPSAGATFTALDITERKRAQMASEKRIVALTRPLEDTTDVEFEDLFNLEDIQRLQDQFANATGVASMIIRPDGTPITKPTNFCRLCQDVIRKTEKGLANCRRSDATIGRAKVDGPILRPCLGCGLWDAGAAISVGGKHIASWLVGQVRDETQTEEQVRQYARQIGADEDDAVEAFAEVQGMSSERFEMIAKAVFTLAGQLSTTAYQNIQQARFISERDAAMESLLRLECGVEQATDGIAVADMDGATQFVNSAWAHMHGTSREETLGRSLTEFLASHRTDSESGSLLDRLRREGQVEGEVEHARADGAVFETWMSCSLMRDAAGTAVGIVALARDITEQKHREEQFRQAQKMEAVGQLAGGVAHDFNNMLSVILGNAEIALGQAEQSDSLQDSIREIQKAAERSADLTRQLLAFARKQTVSPQEVDLNRAVDGMCSMLQRLIGESIELIWMPAENLWSVRIDPTQVDQVLANLSVNARDAIRGVGRITIETENVHLVEPLADGAQTISPGDYVYLRVADNGEGMDAETLAHIFEPFFTTKPNAQGTGLGLSTVYGIVKQNGGHIRVTSQKDLGTAFHVYLPKYESHPSARPAEPHPQTPEAGSETVLFVEDEPAILKLGQIMLQGLGYHVLAASTPTEAMAIAADAGQRIDLLVTDVVMPQMNGRELADRVLDIHPGIKRLFMSGYTADVIATHGVLEEGVHFIQKPFTRKDLAEKVRAVLDGE